VKKERFFKNGEKRCTVNTPAIPGLEKCQTVQNSKRVQWSADYADYGGA
jgi:hypothetical protein